MGRFGSSGIRGVVNEDITPQFGVSLGCAVGSLYKRVALAHDTRTSNIMLSSAVMAGLISTGAEAHFLGMASTPTLAYAARKFDCGIMVTASHNPAKYNGVKLWNSTGIAFSEKQEREIEAMLNSSKYAYVKWDGLKPSHSYRSAVREHADKIREQIGPLALKVVVDCGCGAASTITPYLLRELGCTVITVNCQPDGHFPGREPEPVEENLATLMGTVRALGADLGIAHDGDADRMTAVDETGAYVGGDKLLGIFTKFEAKRKIVVPVDASMALEETGAEVVRTRVGDVFIAQEIKNSGADFGGEPSGTWIFPEVSLCPDGVYAAARLAKLVKEKGKLSSLAAGIKSYPMLRGKIDYTPEKKEKVRAALGKALAGVKGADIQTIDGTRLAFKDSWAVVRLSGTEPKIRITVEAKTQKAAGELYAKMEKAVKGCI